MSDYNMCNVHVLYIAFLCPDVIGHLMMVHIAAISNS